MGQLLLFALLGLGQGALVSGIAVAVVVTYRGSGVINLATGAVAMVAAALRGDWEEARRIYRWFMPLLHLDADHEMV